MITDVLDRTRGHSYQYFVPENRSDVMLYSVSLLLGIGNHEVSIIRTQALHSLRHESPIKTLSYQSIQLKSILRILRPLPLCRPS